MNNLKVIAFDADDTLWVNEPYFREVEDLFCALLEDYLPMHSSAKELFKIEMQNLELYGYGIKAFMLSMIETISVITESKGSLKLVEETIKLGKEMLEKPIELLEGVEDTLKALKGKYRLVVATKGDLLDQERKLRKSGLEEYFHHIEIMSEKRTADYQKLIKHLDIKPSEFMMIGNSVKSDILPVLELGGWGVHVPYHTTWAHELVDVEIENEQFKQVEKLDDVLGFLHKN
ncbi:MAG: HAD family hydrolase [Cytophagaceae bacterium]|nr:HAD family hydrolase [Cytophagaceae bacterium]MBK9935086.1 HAD family hydrolase [Cytophagaceae bacterium]MBL0301527.1 HAD family hydrolase [Cytophagaceae bacterium]MBL0324349.1 HAD family hydrolase [Cytophagaceae bacterium]